MKATKPSEGKDDGAQLLIATADVGPVSGANHLPQSLILGRFVPLFVNARSNCQRACINVLQHLEEKILVEMHKPSLLIHLLPNFFFFFALLLLRFITIDRWIFVGVGCSLHLRFTATPR